MFPAQEKNRQEGIAYIYAPEPDGQDVQEPTPIAGADTGGHTTPDGILAAFPRRTLRCPQFR